MHFKLSTSLVVTFNFYFLILVQLKASQDVVVPLKSKQINNWILSYCEVGKQKGWHKTILHMQTWHPSLYLGDLTISDVVSLVTYM